MQSRVERRRIQRRSDSQTRNSSSVSQANRDYNSTRNIFYIVFIIVLVITGGILLAPFFRSKNSSNEFNKAGSALSDDDPYSTSYAKLTQEFIPELVKNISINPDIRVSNYNNTKDVNKPWLNNDDTVFPMRKLIAKQYDCAFDKFMQRQKDLFMKGKPIASMQDAWQIKLTQAFYVIIFIQLLLCMRLY